MGNKLTSSQCSPKVRAANRNLAHVSPGRGSMRLNFKGRVGKVQLSPNRALHPLFEAIVNSIHSIKDLKISDGRIDVIAEREESAQGSFIDNYDSRPIRNFIIQDNGVGFNQINFDSFDTSDTTLKEGAKGIGRFLWLITFDAVHIESVFSEDGRFYKRTFDFALTDNGVENAELSESNATERFTVVRLLGLKQRYQEKGEKGLETIADKIIEHCLYYFMQPKCPTITLSDGKEEINLNDLYNNNNVKGRNRPEKFDINGEEFSIINLRLYLSKERKHRIFFCANERAVKSIDVSSRIPDISARKITDTNGDAFKYAAYVSGKFLDEKVNKERRDFSLPLQISDLEFAGEVSWEELVRRSTEKAREFLRPHLEPISQDKITRIKRYINEVPPQYKPIIKYKAGLLDDIKPGLSDDQLDAELYRIYHGIHSELRAHYKQLLSKTAEDVTDLEKYKQDYKTLVEQLNDVSKSELAQYVVHRKLILNLLEEALKIKGDGEYSYEDRIHQMIYPMRLTSDDVPYEQQNLWIIEERLNYHDYLASDKVLSTYGNLKTKSQCRPEIGRAH